MVYIRRYLEMATPLVRLALFLYPGYRLCAAGDYEHLRRQVWHHAACWSLFCSQACVTTQLVAQLRRIGWPVHALPLLQLALNELLLLQRHSFQPVALVLLESGVTTPDN